MNEEKTNSLNQKEKKVEESVGQYGVEEKIVEKKSKVFYLKIFVDLFFVLTLNVVAFRVALKFLGIEVTNPFAGLLYLITEPLVKPFLNLFPQLLFVSNSSILEGGSIIALILLFLFGKLLIKLIHLIETK